MWLLICYLARLMALIFLVSGISHHDFCVSSRFIGLFSILGEAANWSGRQGNIFW